MKKMISLLILIMTPLLAYAAFPPHANVSTCDVNKVTGAWDNFTWKWVGFSSQSNTIVFTNFTDLDDYIAAFKVSRYTEAGTQQTYLNITNFTLTTNSATWTVSYTNVPPNRQYLAEFFCWDAAVTNLTRTLAQGKITVVNSLYQDNDSLYPWPAGVTNLVEYLLITQAVANYARFAYSNVFSAANHFTNGIYGHGATNLEQRLEIAMTNGTGALNAHTALVGTAAHSLGSASTNSTTDFAIGGRANSFVPTNSCSSNWYWSGTARPFFGGTNIDNLFTPLSATNKYLLTNDTRAVNLPELYRMSNIWVDADGDVGIGTNSILYDLQVGDGVGDEAISIVAGAGGGANLWLGDAADQSIGGISYDNGTDTMTIRSGNGTAAKIDGNRNWGFNHTNPLYRIHLIDGAVYAPTGIFPVVNAVGSNDWEYARLQSVNAGTNITSLQSLQNWSNALVHIYGSDGKPKSYTNNFLAAYSNVTVGDIVTLSPGSTYTIPDAVTVTTRHDVTVCSAVPGKKAIISRASGASWCWYLPLTNFARFSDIEFQYTQLFAAGGWSLNGGTSEFRRCAFSPSGTPPLPTITAQANTTNRLILESTYLAGDITISSGAALNGFFYSGSDTANTNFSARTYYSIPNFVVTNGMNTTARIKLNGTNYMIAGDGGSGDYLADGTVAMTGFGNAGGKGWTNAALYSGSTGEFTVAIFLNSTSINSRVFQAITNIVAGANMTVGITGQTATVSSSGGGAGGTNIWEWWGTKGFFGGSIGGPAATQTCYVTNTACFYFTLTNSCAFDFATNGLPTNYFVDASLQLIHDGNVNVYTASFVSVKSPGGATAYTLANSTNTVDLFRLKWLPQYTSSLGGAWCLVDHIGDLR